MPLLAWIPVLALAAAPATRPAEAPTIIAVFDFLPTGEADRDLGVRVAEAIVAKILRTEGYVAVDQHSLREAAAGASFTLTENTTAEMMALLGRKVIGARVIVWGTVERRGERFTLHARALDLGGEKPDLYLERDFPADGWREIPFAAQRIVNALRRDTDAPDPAIDPRDPGPTTSDPKVLARPNLLTNGSFDQGDTTPAGWEPVNGLTSFWVPAPDRPGKCVMFDTDVNAEQWIAWNKKFTLGTDEVPPAPIRGTGPKYDTVGGTYGAWLYSAGWIPVKPGQVYRISFDYRGASSGKVWVKGYAEFPGERREVYRAYKNCREAVPGQWMHYTRTFNPTERAPAVKWMRVELYTYWPPGRYYFDNVHLCEEPR